mgnify:FL=1
MLHRFTLIAIVVFIFSSCSFKARESYQELLKNYRTSKTLEDKVFDRLIFRLSERSLDDSINFKFLVYDQLGREWLFKAGPAAAEAGAVAIYELFRIFGLDTPEIHKKTFQVNGQTISGSLQRFVPNLGSIQKLKLLDMSFLNSEIGRAHV